jgi:hypothetical protein
MNSEVTSKALKKQKRKHKGGKRKTGQKRKKAQSNSRNKVASHVEIRQPRH